MGFATVMPYTQKNIIKEIADLGLPLGSYIACGGSTLAVRGIRETKDIDIIILPSLFEKLRADGWKLDPEYQMKWNRMRLKKGDVEIYPDLYLEKKKEFLDVPSFIADAEIIDGIPFQKLDHLVMCKLDTGREKDLKDIESIRGYLASHK